MPHTPRDTATYIEVSGQMLHARRLRDDLDGPPLVFLHEGLGSVELWRTFPEAVVSASGHRGFLYDRRGNGWSTPLRARRRPDYMHEEALEYLPAILESVCGETPILIGHSDGASIALIHAGAGYEVAGLVLIAPHVFVENETIESISALREEFEKSDLGARMAKYHERPEITFRGWADVWLSSSFRGWNIEDSVTGVRSPTLLIQGDEDQYGTVSQLDAIEALLTTPAERLVVEGAGHAPHLSHSRLVTDRVVDFLARLGT